MSEQRFSFKAFISFALLVGGVLVATAGVVLYIAPPGRVANMIDWRFMGLGRTEWRAIRTIFALFFIIAGSIHLYFNWGTFKSYLSRRGASQRARHWELGSAVMLVVLLVVLTVRETRPFSSIVHLGDRVSAAWSVPASQASPAQPASRELTTVIAEPGEERAPDELRGTGSGTGGGTGSGATPGSGTGEGLGRLTLQAFCEREGIPLSEAIARLEAAGISAGASDLLRSVAANAGSAPNELAAIVRRP